MQNSIYGKLSKVKLLKSSYARKFLIVAFVGIHIPLIGLIIYVALNAPFTHPLNVIAISIILTLIATLITLYFINKLLLPVIKSQIALTAYYAQGTLPELPLHYRDEAGILMQKIQETLTALHGHITEKTDLAALISHDLRAPFAQMMGILEIIKLEDDKANINSYCNQMIAEGNKQLRFLEMVLLEMRKPPGAPQSPTTAKTEARVLIEQCIHRYLPEASKKDVEINTSIKENPIIEIEEGFADHALGNLISNAVKYSFPKGKVSINSERRNGSFILTVKDQGIGFNPANAERLFKRFIKGQAGTQGEPSTGFGLYSSRQTVERHGGTLTCKSEGHQKGAVFTLRLPLANT